MRVIFVPRRVAQVVGCGYLAYYGLLFGCLAFLFFASHHGAVRHHRTPHEMQQHQHK